MLQLLWKFESMFEPLLPHQKFKRRALKSAIVGMLIIHASVTIGTLGYHCIAKLAWIDALLDACMLLGGMGQVSKLETVGGKLFAAGYALYGGLIFLGSFAVFLAPWAHRAFHHFHLDPSFREKSR